MSNAISVTVPRDAALLLLAARFLADAAAHVAEAADAVESKLDASAPEATPEEVATPKLVEVMDDVFVPVDDTPEIGPQAILDPILPRVDVAAAFASKPAPSMFDEPVPEYQMTDTAEGFSREEYHEAGWTDDALLSSGKMRQVVKPPAAPVAAAPTPTPAPMAPTPSSTTTPVHTPAPPISGATANDVDSKGTPWDSRIHASTKTKMASDGTWKLKRGVDKAEVDAVMAQLRQLQGNAPRVAAPVPAPAAAPGGEKPGAALMRRMTAAIGSKTLDNAQILEAVRHPTVGLKEVRELCLPENAHLVPIAEKLMFPG